MGQHKGKKYKLREVNGNAGNGMRVERACLVLVMGEYKGLDRT